MDINESSKLAMMVCEQALGRELTIEEAKILGISFELGRKYGVE